MALLAAVAGMGYSQQDLCKVSALIDPRNPVPGEPIVYIVQVDCPSLQETPLVQPPDLAPDSGLSEFEPAGTATQIQVINGQMRKIYEFRYSFAASKPGEFEIPPATVAADGQIFESNRVRFHVSQTPQSSSAELPPELNNLVAPPRVPEAPQLEKGLFGKIFILPVIETTQPLSGQQILLSYHLFIDPEGLKSARLNPGRIRGTGEIQVPQLKEFLKEELYGLPQNLRFEEQIINSRRYAVAPLYQVAVTPTRTGHIVIEPFRLPLRFGLIGAARRPSLFDSPFDDLLLFDPFDEEGITVTAQSIPLELDVQALPKPAPPDFCGAVGTFTLSASVDKDHVTANEDVIRLRLVLEGEGNAAVASPPSLPAIDGIQLLEEPKTSTSKKVNNNKLVTSKTFDFYLRATRSGKVVIPPVSMTVFDTKNYRYESLKTQEITLTVAPGTNTSVLTALTTATLPSPTSPREPASAPRKELRYIHEGELALEDSQVNARETLFLALIAAASTAIAVVSLIVSVVRRRRMQDPYAYKKGQAYRKFVDRLNSLKRSAGTNSTAFCEQIAEVLREYLAALLRGEPSAMTTEEICNGLAERNVPEEKIVQLRQLLEKCDSARYAPIAYSQSELMELLEKARQIVEETSACD